jgi:hypothetical protein
VTFLKVLEGSLFAERENTPEKENEEEETEEASSKEGTAVEHVLESTWMGRHGNPRGVRSDGHKQAGCCGSLENRSGNGWRRADTVIETL